MLRGPRHADGIQQLLVRVLPQQLARGRIEAGKELLIAVEIEPAVLQAQRPAIDRLLFAMMPEDLFRARIDGQERAAEAILVVVVLPPRPARAADAVAAQRDLRRFLLANHGVEDPLTPALSPEGRGSTFEGHPLPRRSIRKILGHDNLIAHLPR